MLIPARTPLASMMLLAVAFSSSALAGPAAKDGDRGPLVRLIATGGTISNRDGGRLTADDLVALVPDLGRYARGEAVQFSHVASSELTLDQWLALARRINQLFASDAGVSGVVVTCGTDTLEELAFFLHLTIRDTRPVVVVGSMRNPSTLGYEGAANLLAGVRVAAEPASKGLGVLVALNDQINSARDVTKTDARRLDTFEARSYGVLGFVDRDRVAYYRRPLKRHTTESEFDVATIRKLPRVDVLMVYQGADGDLIRAAADNGAQGIVIAGAGMGATSGTQDKGVRHALDRGVTVVISTRTGSGRVAPQRSRAAGAETASSRGDGVTIAAEDLSPVKARILLMLALTRTGNLAEIQRMFSEY